MSNFTDTYGMEYKITEDGIDFLFLSEGKRDVMKIIRYSYIMNYQGTDLYNLAFGDFNQRFDSLTDDKITNNGDQYSVYHTVLLTIDYFFKVFKDAMLMVRGSDSTQFFQKQCRLTCSKKCSTGTCKKAHRRIRIYRQYVDKYFGELCWEYNFFGSAANFDNQLIIEGYLPGRYYLTVLLRKCKFTI